MTGIMPDSGVPASDAKNSLSNPALTGGCNGLWYSTSRCQPRFDPAAANAVEAEIINLANAAELAYDCSRLDNIERSVRYLIQRGLPTVAAFQSGPNHYTAFLDPTATRINDGMVLTLLPNIVNTGPSWLNVDNHGEALIVRNDGMNVVAGDLPSWNPILLVYWGGEWHIVGLVKSQIPPPIQFSGSVDLWIRTDGNDNNDGSSNDPSHAFLTIDGAWAAAGSRYLSTPLFTINLRLGIPGTYRGGALGPFGGNLYLWGDEGNPGGYVLTGRDIGNGNWGCIEMDGCNRCIIRGVTLLRDGQPGWSAYNAWCGTGGMAFYNCVFDSAVANASSSFLFVGGNAALGTNTSFIGRGLAVGSAVIANYRGFWGVSGVTASFYDCAWQHAALVSVGNSFIKWDVNTPIGQSNCSGQQWAVDENSTINMHGAVPPGTTGGTQNNGGIYIP